jgi:hypothetical protein
MAIVFLVAIAGCEKTKVEEAVDLQKGALRRELFAECMKLLPAGPNHTKYNDWAEVVETCNSHSLYLLNTTCPGKTCNWKPE